MFYLRRLVQEVFNRDRLLHLMYSAFHPGHLPLCSKVRGHTLLHQLCAVLTGLHLLKDPACREAQFLPAHTVSHTAVTCLNRPLPCKLPTCLLHPGPRFAVRPRQTSAESHLHLPHMQTLMERLRLKAIMVFLLNLIPSQTPLLKGLPRVPRWALLVLADLADLLQDLRLAVVTALPIHPQRRRKDQLLVLHPSIVSRSFYVETMAVD